MCSRQHRHEKAGKAPFGRDGDAHSPHLGRTASEDKRPERRAVAEQKNRGSDGREALRRGRAAMSGLRERARDPSAPRCGHQGRGAQRVMTFDVHAPY